MYFKRVRESLVKMGSQPQQQRPQASDADRCVVPERQFDDEDDERRFRKLFNFYLRLNSPKPLTSSTDLDTPTFDKNTPPLLLEISEENYQPPNNLPDLDPPLPQPCRSDRCSSKTPASTDQVATKAPRASSSSPRPPQTCTLFASIPLHSLLSLFRSRSRMVRYAIFSFPPSFA